MSVLPDPHGHTSPAWKDCGWIKKRHRIKHKLQMLCPVPPHYLNGHISYEREVRHATASVQTTACQQCPAESVLSH